MRVVLAGGVLVAPLLAAACSDAPERPGVAEPPEPIELTANVNVQLGDTPAGEQPGYIVTGSVRATRGGVRVGAGIDSVLVYYRTAGSDWTRHVKRSAVPFSDRLPFTVAAGQEYELWSLLYGHGTNAGDTVRALDEWLTSGVGYEP